ncbi:Gfo/Idh/MocA family oxidoreductase [Candidatus Peregrinibacteria bacterium]|nr:Gfo/Idh/MocA family oxidoreductase [Candidatus Peregrinibacteria bacterium]
MPASPIILVGTGPMAVDYAKVLKALKCKFLAIGRGETSTKKFTEETGHEARAGGIEKWLKENPKKSVTAIVAVTENELGKVTLALMKNGYRKILVEKPGGASLQEIDKVAHAAKTHGAKVYVAYNRRFNSSTQKAREIIRKDGGVKSFNFEFTEWSHVIKDLKKAPGVKEHWFIHNSSHVVDLAFFLGGNPKKISSYTAGKLPWHPAAAIFAGAGISEKGALFSYQANWQSPGRWGVEILTKKHRLIFRPLEQLQIQEIGSVGINPVEIDNKLDLNFKPGLYKEVQSFLGKNEDLCMISEQQRNLTFYKTICPPQRHLGQ